jgi:thioredoxin-like negative regulator of GroEL
VIDDFTGSGDEVGSFCTEKYQQKNIPYTALPSEYGDGDVITLDDANFDEIVSSSNEIWMIKFGAPWCYHCNVVKPKWANVAKELGGKVRFATIDADKNRGLAKRFKISKLPTLRYYNAGYGKTDENVLSYTGKREEKPILEFATNLH